MKITTKKLVFIALMAAITIILGITPLGFITIGPAKITLLHVPTIIAAIYLGPLAGALTGLLFGLFSIYQNLVAPTALSFVFYNPLVSILPRILIGLLSGFLYQTLSNSSKKTLVYSLTAIFGTFVNTCFVLGMAGLLYHQQILETFHLPASKFLLAIALKNMPLEMIFSALIVPMIMNGIGKSKL